MKPVRVCFVSLSAYHLFNPGIRSEFGGAELQLYYLATELAKDAQFEIIFVTSDFGQPDIEVRVGVKLYKLFSPPKKPRYIRTIIEYMRLWLLLKKINADVYIQRAAGIITGWSALFCRLNRKKFIYMTAHDADVIDKKPSWMPGETVGNIIWKFFRMGLRLADLVIVQHQEQKENLKKLYNKEGYIRPSAHRILGDNNLLHKEFILWVARCEDWKQPEFFLELAKSFPEEKFYMVCPRSHSSEYFEEIRNQALKLSNVRFFDYVPFSKIDDFFLKAKVFINTSKKEGFPNTFIQAFQRKTPVLSLNVNPDDILERYNIGRCSEGDFSQLKFYLKDLLNNITILREMSENAYKYAKNKHDVQKIIEEDKEIILKIMKP